MRNTTKWLIGASAAVLAVTNAVVLVGVAYNRHAPPQSVLNLTERELSSNPDRMWGDGDDTGLSLRLNFRTEPLGDAPPGELWRYFADTPWLDKNKLAALGVDVSSPATAPDSSAHYDRMLAQNVLLVLELDGPTRERILQRARDAAARMEAAVAADPPRGAEDPTQGATDPPRGAADPPRGAADPPRGVERVTRLKDARDALKTEQDESSRLFVVDAGLDRQTLERRYPDRSRYAIVRGRIRPHVVGELSSARLYGWVTDVSGDTLNVPLQFRGVFPASSSGFFRIRKYGGPRFHVAVAFGRRLEPWIVSANAG
jgi:hypothetical protein